jgi:chitodextrinase
MVTLLALFATPALAAIEVTIDTVDPQGSHLPGLVHISGITAVGPAPFTYTLAAGGPLPVAADFGGRRIYQPITVQEGGIYTIDGTGPLFWGDGPVTSTSGAGAGRAEVHIVFLPLELRVAGVDPAGTVLPQQRVHLFSVDGTATAGPALYSGLVANGGTVSPVVDFGGRRVFQTISAMWQDTNYSIDATGPLFWGDGPVTSTSGAGAARAEVHVVLLPLELRVAGVDPAGTVLPQQRVHLSGVDGTATTGPALYSGLVANGGTVSPVVDFGGRRAYQVIGAAWQDTIYSIDATGAGFWGDGPMTSEPGAGAARAEVRVRFLPIDLHVEAVDPSGNLLPHWVHLSGVAGSSRPGPTTYSSAGPFYVANGGTVSPTVDVSGQRIFQTIPSVQADTLYTIDTVANTGYWGNWPMTETAGAGADRAAVRVIAAAAPAPTPNKPPVANAGADQERLVCEAALLDGSRSFDSDGSIVSYSWSFGDGGTAGGATAAHTYTSPGEFTATLTVVDNGGLTASDSARVRVLSPAEAIDRLWTMVGDLGLSAGRTNSLRVKLDAAKAALARNDRQAAMGALGAFVNAVSALVGNGGIDPAQGQAIIDLAQRAATSVGC